MKLTIPVAVILLAATAGTSQAQLFFVTDYAGYTGAWTKYASLADAVSDSNPLTSGAIPQRNLGIYVTGGAYPAGGSAPDSSIFTTNWYSSVNGTPGTGNTSNSSLGFFQLYNDPSINLTHAASWDPALHTLTLSEAGHNISGGLGSESRFSPLGGLGIHETQGEFISYSALAIATGLTGVPNGPNIQDVTGRALNYSGTFDAVFQNKGGNPALEGFYGIHLAINGVTSLDGSFVNFINPQDQFSSTVVAVPEVAGLPTISLLFATITGIEVCRRRRTR